MTRNPEEDFIQRATEEMEEDGTEGSFTAQARRAGYSDTLAFAEAVMAGWRSGSKKVLNKKTGREQGVTLKTMRRANFALNAQKRRNPQKPRRSHGIKGEVAGLHVRIFREDDGTFYYTVTDKEGNTHAGVALSNKEALQKVRTLARSLSANPAPAQDSFEAVEEILIEEGGAAGLKALKPAFSKPSQAKARLAKMPGIMQHETGDYALREGWDKPRRNPLHNYLVKDRKGVDVALTTTMEEAESVKPKGGSIHAL